MRRLASIAVCTALAASPAAGASLREAYQSCVANADLDLLVQGQPQTRLTAERAVQACETELQALYSLLINTNMDPKLALAMISSIRSHAKIGLLVRK